MSPLFELSLLGLTIPVTYSVVAQWVVMIFIMISTLLITSRINEIPKGKQVWAEYIVEKIDGMIRENMGGGFEQFTPYIGTLIIYLLLLNLTGIVGFKPPTLIIAWHWG
jgi:F-type H+-transporting ATPase subunit a